MSETSGSSGKSTHAFMREALDVQARLREDRRAWVASALASESNVLDCGAGYAAHEVERYFAARSAGLAAPRPQLQPMTALIYSSSALADLERIYATLEAEDPTLAANSVALIGAAIRDLADEPLLGRPAEQGLRERVVSRGRTGYVVLYRHREPPGLVLVLAVRHRYAAGYPRTD